jgi:hypothetical protein
MSKITRPSFNIDFNDNKYEIKAGGVMIYKKNNNTIDFLMVYNRQRYEDLGGCTDLGDSEINITIAREVEEESNKLFNQKDIFKRIKEADYYVSPKSKYMFYLIEATDTESKFVSTDFGDRELHDDIPRTIEWINISRFSDKDFLNKLNFRLKTREFFAKIKELNQTL